MFLGTKYILQMVEFGACLNSGFLFYTAWDQWPGNTAVSKTDNIQKECEYHISEGLEQATFLQMSSKPY